MQQLAAGTEVAGRFVVLNAIGEGGMGTVYRALQRSLDREVALKVLRSDAAFTARARRRFGREARAVARLNHPHIAAVYDFGTDDDDQTLWLAMELVEGQAMTELLRGEVDLVRLLSLTDQVLSALSAAHARGIVHRDLKPSNVLLSRDDDGREIIKLVDFGLVATMTGQTLSLDDAPGGLGDEASETTSGGKAPVMGTPRYMAPEVFRRQPIDARADLYALGVILFEILSGQPPYPGDDPRHVMRQHLRDPIPQLVTIGDIALPTELERLIYRLLAKDISERPATAADVRDVILQTISEFSVGPWFVTGPQAEQANRSQVGFLSGFGARTITPAAMFLGRSSPQLGQPTAPLVGRVEDKRRVEKEVRAVISDQRFGFVVLSGEEGIGKSRLIEWLRVRVEESGVMRSVTGKHGRTSGGFDGIRAALDTLLETSEFGYDDLEYVVRRKAKQWDFGEDDIELLVRLMLPGGDEALFSGESPSHEHRVSDRERVFAVVERVFRKFSQHRPLLLVIEGLNYASEATFSFLEQLAVGMNLSPAAILIVATVDAEEEVPEALQQMFVRIERFAGDEFSRLRLEELSIDESAQLAQKLAPLADDVALQIAERSGGNPLHLSQLIKYLQDSGALVFENGRWSLSASADLASSIPAELEALVRQRAQRAASRHDNPHAVRQILELAAVLGTRFDYRLLRTYVSQVSATLLAVLDEVLEYLVRDGVFREVSGRGDDVLEFVHVVLRDVLLGEIDSQRGKRDLHRIAAERKIAFYGNRVREHATEIADHYRRARDPAGVYVYTLKAARNALATSDLRSAVDLFREAEEVALRHDDVGEPSDGLAEASYVLASDQVALEVATLELRLGEYEKARQHYRHLLRSDTPSVALWARWGLGELAIARGETDEAGGWFDAARREVEKARDDLDASDRLLLLAQSVLGLGRLALVRGELPTAETFLREALDAARETGHRSLEARVLTTLAELALDQGDSERADIYRRRAEILAESAGDLEVRAHSRRCDALADRLAGRFEQAATAIADAERMYDQLGKRHDVAHCKLEEGRIANANGQLRAAAACFREANRLYDAFSDRRGIAHTKLYLGELAFAIAKVRESATLVRDALEEYRKMDDRRGVALSGLLLGEVALETGDLGRAKDRFRAALRELELLGDPVNNIRGRVLLAAAELADGIDSPEGLGPVLNDLDEINTLDAGVQRALRRISASLPESKAGVRGAIDGFIRPV